MNPPYLKYLLAAGLLALTQVAQAEDIDIYTGAPTSPPNVLIIVDNTANWNTAFASEMAALASTFSALPENKFRVGVMLFSETGKVDNNVSGGYVRGAIRLMDGNNKTKYKALVESFDKIADKGNGGVSSLVMAEAYRYLAGGAPYAGNFKGKADYTGNTYGTAASRAVYDLPNNALSGYGATTYNSPVQSGCQKNVIIYISNGASQDNTNVITQSESMLAQAAAAANITGATETIPLSPSDSEENPVDEWALFMKNSSLGVTTFTIDVDKVTNPDSQGPGWSALLQSAATVSGGTYFDVSSADPGSIAAAIAQVFSNIQDVDSAFASVALPESALEGTFLNQVFISMFRPDKTGAPRWAGNLKQYRFGLDATGALALLDADGNRAISSDGTGFIAECARSYWTPTTLDSYWAFKPQGACSVADSDKSNSPDGAVVEKGAQAYMLRSTSARTVKTCSAASCTALTNFNSANVSQADLGAATVAERDALISWAKGVDVDDENNNAATVPVETRPSVHGDVLHSMPLPVNYGTDTAPNIVVFYGTNDGLLHAVNGNRSASIGDVPAGAELWSFMAPEFYPHIKRLRDNTPPVSFYGATFMTDPLPKPYGFDGPITAHKDGNVWLYATMRRGGRAIYAFDVTDPANPSLKWKKGCPNQGDDIGCTAGFDGIGQTWSAPKVAKAVGYGAGASPMLIMGGGYDRCEDDDPHTCTTATKGNKVYVLDADTGNRLVTLNTDRAVVSEVFVVKDASGLAKFGYVADLGGNVYRINIGTAAPAAWTITKIASLGCASPGTCSPNRKFMFAPDVVESNGKYVLLLGSGDREKPLMAYDAAASVANYFFMLEDDPYDPTWLESTNCGSEVICLNSLYHIGLNDSSPTVATVQGYKGWYLSLQPHEQVVTSALTIFGTVYFNTHVPAVVNENVCTSTLGKAYTYKLYYANAANNNGTDSRAQEVAGGGLLGSPSGGMVILDGGGSGSGDTGGDGDGTTGGDGDGTTGGAENPTSTTVPFITGSDPDSGLEGNDPEPPSVVYQPKSRVYWYIQP